MKSKQPIDYAGMYKDLCDMRERAYVKMSDIYYSRWKKELEQLNENLRKHNIECRDFIADLILSGKVDLKKPVAERRATGV